MKTINTKFSKWNSKFDVKKILNLKNEGKNISQIAEILEIPVRRFGEMLKFYDIKLNSNGHIIRKNNNFFEKIDTEIKAYLLGYTLADGSVIIEPKKRNNKIYSYSKRLCFTVSVDDREVINLLKDNISPDSKIKEFHNSKGAINRKNSLSLRFSSNKIVDDLILLNIKPLKTYDTSFIFDFDKIPENLHRHFLRGFFDGDGGFRYTVLNFVSTSVYFLNQLESIFIKELPGVKINKRHVIGKTVNWSTFTFHTGKNNLKQKLFDYFYKDSNFYLQRKKLKFNIENTVLN